MNKTFWNGKKVIITGNTGFKGAWLSRILLDAGAEVFGYALENDCKDSIFNAISLSKQMECCCGDICDSSKLSAFVTKVDPDIVFHLAAQPIVRLSYVDPVTTYQTNVMGTVILLNVLRDCKNLRAIINVTTDKVYANDDKSAFFNEKDRLGGYDPYSNSKACSELVTSSYVSSFFNPEKYGIEHSVAIATARAGNVIGGGDFAPDRLIPDCIRAIKKGEQVVLRNPDSIRPWQNVLEPISMYITLAEKLFNNGIEFSGAWNVGPDKEDCKTVAEVINIFRQYVPQLEVKFGEKATGAPHEAQLLTLDSNKAKNELNFRNRWQLEEAVKYTALWYGKQLEGADMVKVTDDIVSEYFRY